MEISESWMLTRKQMDLATKLTKHRRFTRVDVVQYIIMYIFHTDTEHFGR